MLSQRQKKYCCGFILGAMVSLSTSYLVAQEAVEEDVIILEEKIPADEIVEIDASKLATPKPAQYPQSAAEPNGDTTKKTPEYTLVRMDTPAAWLYKRKCLDGKPYLEQHRPSISQNIVFYLAEDDSCKVDVHKWWNYAVFLTTNRHYEPVTKGGQIFKKVFVALHLMPKNYEYKANPLVETYHAGIPMRWSFDNVENFEKYANNIQENISESEIPSQKPLMLLDINDKSLSAEKIESSKEISAEHKEILKKYFTLPKECELDDVQFFFGESRRFCRKTIGIVRNAKSSSSYYPTLKEHVYHGLLLKKCHQFLWKDIILPSAIIGASVTPFVLNYGEFKGFLKDALKLSKKLVH
jgi:hypothetical protein